MSIFEERRDELEKHEFMMGKSRGQLAVTLDVLTDALVLVGQHGVYCQSARTPGKPAMDIQIISKSISDAKELIASVMTELKTAQPRGGGCIIENAAPWVSASTDKRAAPMLVGARCTAPPSSFVFAAKASASPT